MKKKNYRIPIFVPHRGCPHDCVFCNQKRITGHTAEVSAADAKKIIDEYLLTLADDAYIEIAFFGGSFTGIDFDRQTELLEVAEQYAESGRVHGIRCSTRPDCIDKKILENLKKHCVTCIELGVQSTDEDVLRKSGRGHSFDDVSRAVSLIKEYEIPFGLQMMMGLPGDTYEKTLKTVNDIIALKPDCVRIYPTLVVEDTALYDMYSDSSYTPLELEETVEQLSVIIPMFHRAGIQIIRVGLQTTDDINADTVKGPYHPAIRELAEGRIILKAIEKSITKDAVKTIEIVCSPACVSAVVGQKRCNVQYLRSKYKADVKILQDSAMKNNTVKICGKIVDIYA